MSKSIITNVIALALTLIGYFMPANAAQPYVYAAGLFALSGALTNWLAVHMLFEKIPGLYGSGVIAARFEQFKSGIFTLVMDNFFTEENFAQFADAALHQSMQREKIDELVDMDEIFDSFLDVVTKSKFGGMLGMFGGMKALEPLRAPFKVKMGEKLGEIVEKLDLTKSDLHFESFRPTVEKLVQGKLEQLEPNQVKLIVEQMIREHLGWLVVWGGAFGALIGLLSTLI